MTSGFSAKLEGLRDVRKLLQELPPSVSKRAVRDAMIDAADVFADDAVSRVPVRDGRLRDSMVRTWRIVKEQARGSRKPGKEETRAFVGPNYSRTDAAKKGYAPHAHLVEWGTGPRYTKTGKYLGIADPQPFMRPAFDTQKDVYIKFVSASILFKVEKALARFRKRKLKAK